MFRNVFFSGNWFSWFDKHEMQRDEISSQPTDTTVSDKTSTRLTPMGIYLSLSHTSIQSNRTLNT